MQKCKMREGTNLKPLLTGDLKGTVPSKSAILTRTQHASYLARVKGYWLALMEARMCSHPFTSVSKDEAGDVVEDKRE